MMNFASMKFFLVGLTLTAMLSACSDDETSDLIPEPSISISALESEIGALNFSINVENAEQCAYHPLVFVCQPLLSIFEQTVYYLTLQFHLIPQYF